MRQHRARPADAVQADDVGAGRFDPLAGLGRREAVAGHRLTVKRHRDDRREAGLLDHVERDQGLLGVRERLRDDEVDSGLGRPRGLFLEHRTHRATRLVVLGEDVRVREVAGEERARLVCDLARQLERTAVQRLEQMLLADDPHLLAVAVVREGLNDVGARVHELAVQLRDDLRMVEDDLGDEGAGLEVAAALALEEVALGADHGSRLETLEQPGLASGRHAATLLT